MNMPKGFELQDYADINFPFNLHYDSLGLNLFVDSHWHEEIEILYIVKGKLKLICNQAEYLAEVGDVIFIPSNQIHKMENQNGICDYYCLLAKPRYFQSSYAPDFPPNPIITNNKSIIDYMEQITTEFFQKKSIYKYAIQGHLISMITYFLRCDNAKSANGKIINNNQSGKMQLVIAYIHQHFTEKITLSQVCSIVNYSVPYFCQCFREETGKTFIDYVNTLRCEYAFHLIQAGGYSICQCSEMSGFHNLSYFSKKYVEHFGFLPSQTKPLNKK